MSHTETTSPTIAVIREQAVARGITIAAEREAAILAGARYLHEAARRLDTIAAVEETRPETTGR